MKSRILIVIGIVAVSGLLSISIDYAYAESDFILETHLSLVPSEPAWVVTKFMISGESDKQICPSGQCSVSSEGNPFSPHIPNPKEMYLSYDLDFILKDNMKYPEIGPKKKEFLEQFSTWMYFCRIDDIKEQNGQEVYYCHDDNTISREFDSKRWNYNAIGIYDAKNYVFKVYGNFTGTN